MTEQQRKDLVKYSIELAVSTLSEIEDQRRMGYYNTAVNRMYYACYYAAIALLIAYGKEVKSHAGVRTSLSMNFVKTGILPEDFGAFYSLVFSKRSSGDYEDFFTHDLNAVNELLPQVVNFVRTIKVLVDKWLEEHTDFSHDNGDDN